MPRSVINVPVLIVGAGPAGLVTSLLLGRYGIPSLLVERRQGTSIVPRATGINLRSMEIFRSLGLEPAIQAASMDVRGRPLWVELQTLRGPVLAERHIDAPSGASRLDFPSPCAHLQCAQDRLEPLLLEAIQACSVSNVRFGAELVEFEQDEAGVCAWVRADGAERTEVRARYLIGADGARSQVRAALGIEMAGNEHLGDELSVLFEADLAATVTGREASLFRVHNQSMRATLRPVNNDRRWTLTTPLTGDSSEAACARLIRIAADDPDLELKILAIQEWELGAATALNFRGANVFLVGDAAHRTTPGGAMGMNSAIQDGHNLAWKLAAVVQDWAGPELLDTYEIERRPVDERNVRLSLDIWNDMNRAGRTVGAVLGFSYESGAIVGDGTEPPHVDDPIVDYVPNARPGSRAPHAWIEFEGRRISTLDLFGGRFVLLTPSETWTQSVPIAELGMPLEVAVVQDETWTDLYGLNREGGVLVRPDGHVAWRTRLPVRSGFAAFTAALNEILTLRHPSDQDSATSE